MTLSIEPPSFFGNAKPLKILCLSIYHARHFDRLIPWCFIPTTRVRLVTQKFYGPPSYDYLHNPYFEFQLRVEFSSCIVSLIFAHHNFLAREIITSG